MNKPRLEPEIEKLMLMAAAQDIKRGAEENAGLLLAALLVLTAETINDTGRLDDALSLAREALGKVLGDDIAVMLVQIDDGEC